MKYWKQEARMHLTTTRPAWHPASGEASEASFQPRCRESTRCLPLVFGASHREEVRCKLPFVVGLMVGLYSVVGAAQEPGEVATQDSEAAGELVSAPQDSPLVSAPLVSAPPEAEEAPAPSVQTEEVVSSVATDALPVAAEPELVESSAAPSSAVPASAVESGEAESNSLAVSPQAESSQPPPAQMQTDPRDLPWTYHQRHFDLSLGFRLQSIGHSSFDPFASSDVVGSPELSVGWAPVAFGAWSVAVRPSWGYLRAGDRARGTESLLEAHRLSLGAELRYHFTPAFFAYARLAPGALLSSARLGDSSSHARLESRGWSFHLDSVLGAALRLGGSADGRERSPRFHLYVEAGFDWAWERSLRFQAVESGPLRTQELDWGGLQLSSPHGGLGVRFTL